ncbi:uncharacterized protein LOC120664982 [Panicum virgatum]|uniref:uncharacterized protein LOC120664982 n=1 Tax=Panicum virgatum TaxID=38727 RepID=UPI0019D64EFF|nr:uncharacterized protein LOC120664982 [Panicum virgatum]
MDPLNSNIKDTGVIEDARHRRRERDRARAALMTDEQKEEKNRKRHEAYKRKKCHAQNKENDPVDLNMSNPTTNTAAVCIAPAIDKHTIGSALLEQESDGIMPPLRSNDESIQTRKKHLEANQKLIQGSDRILTPLRSDGKRVGDHKKKYETRINAIGAGDKHGATDEHGAPITSAPDINEHLDGGHHVTPTTSTPIVTEHHTTLSFTEQTTNYIPVDMENHNLSDPCTNVTPDCESIVEYQGLYMAQWYQAVPTDHPYL